MRRNVIVGALKGLFGSALLLSLLGAAGIANAQSGDVPSDAPLAAEVSAATPLTTAFTYQGQLKNGGKAVNGSCDMVFRLHDAATGGGVIGSPLNSVVSVSNGLFTAGLDFGAAFSGDARWLDMQVRCPAGSGAFTQLAPRQQLTATPNALFSAAPWVTSGGNLTYNAGSVGIGTSPGAGITLDVKGATRLTPGGRGGEIALAAPNGETGLTIKGATTRADVRFDGTTLKLVAGSGVGPPASTSGVVVDTSGNVGIGTLVPTSKLEIAAQNGLAITGYQPYLTLRDTNAGNARSVFQAAAGGFYFYTSPSIGGIPPMALVSNGNVGIGTPYPAHHLSIAGGPTWTSNGWAGAVALSNASAIGWQANSGGQRFGIGQTNGGLAFFRTASDPGTTASPATYDMFINDAGNIGIGNIDPYSKLSVNGSLSANGITDFGNFSFQTSGSVGQTALCYNGGTLKTLATCSSSLRYKTDVRPYAGGMDVVNRVQPVTFKWKDGGALDLGFVAEDIAAVEPLFVTYNDSGEIEGVKYERMGVLFANALKEQQAQIERQQAQIHEQQNQIDSLKTLVCQDHPDAALCK